MCIRAFHARTGVSCADCHMPYMREGTAKLSDHWVRSPLLNVNRACQTCHSVPEQEMQGARPRDPGAEPRADPARCQGHHRHARRHRGGAEGRRQLKPSSSRRGSCTGRRSGGSTSSPPRTPWASTRPRSSRGSSARRSTSRARASSRRTARPGGSERGAACGPPLWSGSGVPPGLRRNRLTGKIDAVRAPSRARLSVVLPTALERNAPR